LHGFLDVCEGLASKLNKEIVHNIRIVSLQRRSIWSNTNWEDTLNLLKLIIIIIKFVLFWNISSIFSIFFSNTGLLLFSSLFVHQNSHLELSENNIYIVVEINIELDSIDYIEVTSTFFVVTTNIWDGALSGEDLCHVVVLYVRERFFVIFISSADKIMQIINQREDTSVHLHQLDQSHVSILEILPVLAIENLFKRCHDNYNLGITKSIG